MAAGYFATVNTAQRREKATEKMATIAFTLKKVIEKAVGCGVIHSEILLQAPSAGTSTNTRVISLGPWGNRRRAWTRDTPTPAFLLALISMYTIV